MSAKGPGSRTRLWAATLLLLGLPGLSVRAEGECLGSAREAAGPGWRVGKVKLAGAAPSDEPGTLPAWEETRSAAVLRFRLPLAAHRVPARPNAPQGP